MRPPCPPGHLPAKRTAAAGLEPAHTRLQDERSDYPFELRRKDGPGGTRTLTRSLQDFYAAFTSPALEELRRRDLNPRPAVYETAALPLSYSAPKCRRAWQDSNLRHPV